MYSFRRAIIVAGRGISRQVHTSTQNTSFPVTELSKEEFRRASITHIESLNSHTKKYILSVNGESPVASFVVLRDEDAVKDANGNPVAKAYTPLKAIENNELELLIKAYKVGGTLSVHIDKLQVGDTIEVKGPIVKKEYTPNLAKDVVFFAGGTGITPCYQIIDKMLKTPEDTSNITLIFANSSESDMFMKAELEALKAEHKDKKFDIHYVLTEPPSSAEMKNALVGFLSQSMVSSIIPAGNSDVYAFVCGPPGFNNAICGPKTKDFKQGELQGFLEKMGYTSDNVFKL